MRLAALALTLGWAWPSLANDVQSCKVRVAHGATTVELRQARDTATEITGRIRPLCRAELTVTSPGRDPEVRAWKDIHPSGDRFGVALLPGAVAGLLRVAKYGDGDGRLVLVAKDGRILDLPGPEHVVQGRWLVSVGASGALDVAVVDAARLVVTDRLEGRQEGGDARLAALRALGLVVGAVRDGRELVLVFESSAGHRVGLARLDESAGVFVPSPGPRPDGPDLLARRAWTDCSCQQ